MPAGTLDIQQRVGAAWAEYKRFCREQDIDLAWLKLLHGHPGATQKHEARMSILTPDGFRTLLLRLGNVLDGRFTPRNCVFVECGVGGGHLLMLAHGLNIQCIGFEREKKYLQIARKATV
eukprot:COSAG01_NODE_4069_length_5383_cov_6.046556_4_plen_120_part_00